MLKLTIKAKELFNDDTQKFITIKEDVVLTLEHSLVSLSKWEQTWEKPFLGKEKHTTEQTIDYIRCMTLAPENPPEHTYDMLSPQNFEDVSAYINRKMTATWFNEIPGQANRQSETITAEVIYYWLVALTIPFEVQHWHLNSLLTLIRVTNIKNDPKKKTMPQATAAQMQREQNAARKARLGTKG